MVIPPDNEHSQLHQQIRDQGKINLYKKQSSKNIRPNSTIEHSSLGHDIGTCPLKL